MLALLTALAIAAEPKPVDLAKMLNESKSCHAQKHDPNTIECDFKLGSSLRINIAGVGEDLASVSFDKSDRDGDYFAKYQVGVGCILVITGEKLPLVPPAFINPRTAVVYASWQACQASAQR